MLSVVDIDTFVPDTRLGNPGFMRKMVSIEELPYKYLVVCYRLSEPARAGRDIATILSCVYSVLSLVFFYADHGRYTRVDEHIVAALPLAYMLGGYIFHRIHDATSRSILLTDNLANYYDTILHQASLDAILEADRVLAGWHSWVTEDIKHRNTLADAAPVVYSEDRHGPRVRRDVAVLTASAAAAATAVTAGEAADARAAADSAAGRAGRAKAAANVAVGHKIATRRPGGTADVSAALRRATAADGAARDAADESAAVAGDVTAAESAYAAAIGEAAARAAVGRAAEAAADAAAVQTFAANAAAAAAAAAVIAAGRLRRRCRYIC